MKAKAASRTLLIGSQSARDAFATKVRIGRSFAEPVPTFKG